MKERYDYIDVLRGFTMLMVIYGHFVLKIAQINGEEILRIGILCGKIMTRIRMPMFFFVSGFFAYAIYDIYLFRKRITNRIKQQLWPTIVVCGLFILLTGCNSSGGGNAKFQ